MKFLNFVLGLMFLSLASTFACAASIGSPGFITSVTANANLGTNGTCSISSESTGLFGVVHMHMDAGAAGVQCTLNFPARRYALNCVIAPASADAATNPYQDNVGNDTVNPSGGYVTTTTSTIVFSKSHNLYLGVLDEVWNYHCIAL